MVPFPPRPKPSTPRDAISSKTEVAWVNSNRIPQPIPVSRKEPNQDPFRVEPVCQWAQQHSACRHTHIHDGDSVAGDGCIVRLGVIDKDDGARHIGLHQTLGQKQGEHTEKEDAAPHEAAGELYPVS